MSKLQIRQGLFETNSSSTHAITITEKEIYEAWERNEVLFCQEENKFLEFDKAIEENLKMLIKSYDLSSDNEEELEELKSKYLETKSLEALVDIGYDDIEYYCFYVTYQEWLEHNAEYYETYTEFYKTKKGENVVAFGYYGQDQ